MKTGRLKEDGLLTLLHEEHEAVNSKLKDLNLALVGLQFEGKSSLGQNLKRVSFVTNFFEHTVLKHMAFEEKIIFPFVSSHIPKLESVIYLLCAQHEDFKRCFEDLRLYVKMLSKGLEDSERSSVIHKIREVGTYLIYLLQHHAHVENMSVYKLIKTELRRHEQEELNMLSSKDSNGHD